MLRVARRVNADRVVGGAHPGSVWGFSSTGVGLIEENLRHEFRSLETRLVLRFRGGARLVAVWPEPDEDGEPAEPYFFLEAGDGVRLKRAHQVRSEIPTLSVLPLLGPVEHQERRLDREYVRGNWGGRLSSRHFRNQLHIMRETTEDDSSALAQFLEWAEPWTPDFTVDELSTRLDDEGIRWLDVFCRERDARTPRELFWAGDGVQVWLQLLMHVYQAAAKDTIVLDEPDLYLHADLQRRLVRVLESMDDVQTVAASHSVELLVEASPRSVAWVAKERQRAVSAPDDRVLTGLSDAIGSQFNLRLARALRARAVLFVEGKDMRLLRNFARTLGARELVREAGLVTVPLEGFSNWEHVEPFSWLIGNLLERTVPVLALLDRDYRTDAQVGAVEQRLEDVGVGCHVWRRKELESYVLEAVPIARLSGAPVAEVESALLRLAEEQKARISARQLAERLQTEVYAHHHGVSVMEAHQEDFEARWASEPARRHHWCNAKDLLTALNGWLQETGYGPVSARHVANRMRREDIPDEMAALIERAEALIGD